MTVYVNTSGQARTWLNLTNPETGRTLHLEPGEEVDLDPKDLEIEHAVQDENGEDQKVREPFDDPWLKPKAGKRAAGKTGKSDQSPDTPEGEE